MTSGNFYHSSVEKKMLDKSEICGIIKTDKRKGNKTMTRDLWIIGITLFAPLFAILVGQIVINCME